MVTYLSLCKSAGSVKRLPRLIEVIPSLVLYGHG
jgi:hypothetical protein